MKCQTLGNERMNIAKRTQKNQTDQDDSLGLDEHHRDHFARASRPLLHSLTFIQARQTIEEFDIELESRADFPKRERMN